MTIKNMHHVSFMLGFLTLYNATLHSAQSTKAHSRAPLVIGICTGVIVMGVITYVLHSAYKTSQAKETAYQKFKKACTHLINAAVQEARKNETNKPVIAIAGAPKSGKSYFAQQLRQALAQQGIKAAIFDFNKFITINKDYAIMTRLLNHLPTMKTRDPEAIIKLKNYESCIWKPNELQEFADADVILFEGDYTLRDDDTYQLLEYSTIKIFIEVLSEISIHKDYTNKFAQPAKRADYHVIRSAFNQYRTFTFQNR